MVIPHVRFDSSISAGGQLSRKDIDRLAKEGFRSILNLSEEEEPGQFLSPNVEATWAHANAMEHGRVSVFVDHLHSHWVDLLLEALDELPRPVYVHSETRTSGRSNSRGRSKRAPELSREEPLPQRESLAKRSLFPRFGVPQPVADALRASFSRALPA